MAGRYDKVKVAFQYLVTCERNDTVFQLEELAAATGWKVSSCRTYLSKKWSFVVSQATGGYKVLGLASLGYNGFLKEHTQSSRAPTDHPPVVLELIQKARQSALLGVSVYNNPMVEFRTHSFIVHMAIAWTSLFHAVFEKRGTEYTYKDKDGNPVVVDGETKAWELSQCIKKYWEDNQPPERRNLEFLTGLRNRIEHRFLPAVDLAVAGECQAGLLNFEKLLASEMGHEHSLDAALAVSLQMTRISVERKVEALRQLQSENYQIVREYIDTFRQGLTQATLDSQEYRISVFLIPKIGNRASSSDLCIEFVKYDPARPDDMESLEKVVALIKEKAAGGSNYRFKPGQVAKLVAAELEGKVFNTTTHARAWKYYGARGDGNVEGPTRKEFCHWEVDRYLYTEKWVEFLVNELKDNMKYTTVDSYRGASRLTETG